MKSFDKFLDAHKITIVALLIIVGLSFGVLSLSFYRYDICVVVILVFSPLMALVVTGHPKIFRNLLYGTMMTDIALSSFFVGALITYGEGSLQEGSVYLLFLSGLAVLSLTSIISLLRSSKTQVIPTITLLTLATNAGNYIYYPIITIILANPSSLPTRALPWLAFNLSIGLFNLFSFFTSLFLLIRHRSQRRKAVQTNNPQSLT